MFCYWQMLEVINAQLRFHRLLLLQNRSGMGAEHLYYRANLSVVLNLLFYHLSHNFRMLDLLVCKQCLFQGFRNSDPKHQKYAKLAKRWRYLIRHLFQFCYEQERGRKICNPLFGRVYCKAWIHRFENWNDRRALRLPNFFRSTTRLSRVKNPAAFNAPRKLGS